jgi:hypothetical protein
MVAVRRRPDKPGFSSSSVAGYREIGKKAAMITLADKLSDPTVRSEVVKACAGLVETEVAAKRGLSGMALRAGLKLVQAVRPGFVAQVVDRLLPEFAEALEPLHGEAITLAEKRGVSGAESFSIHLEAHADRAAEALLAVSDRRVRRADNRPLVAAYERLRPGAVEHVRLAIPGLVRTLSPFV